MGYLDLKALHILSSTILFGTGLGTAFFMWMANRSKNRQAMAVVTRIVMKADLYFTTPAGFLQAITGAWLMVLAGVPFALYPLNWLSAAVVLYLLAGACWLPVLWLQRTGEPPASRQVLAVRALVDVARHPGVRQPGGGVLAHDSQALVTFDTLPMVASMQPPTSHWNGCISQSQPGRQCTTAI